MNVSDRVLDADGEMTLVNGGVLDGSVSDASGRNCRGFESTKGQGEDQKGRRAKGGGKEKEASVSLSP